jgi:cardiolipin synthase
VDGEVALVPGRNVSRSYYTGLDEVVVTPSTPQGDVPWLDLTTELTGPVVGELEALFVRTWVASGGEPFVAVPPSGRGTIPVWVVAHRGLTDGATIDGLRVLIEAARSRVTLVNTFPLQDELQHLLLRRLADGVAVRVITGHVRPRFRAGELPFPGSAERDLMTELVHGRLDPLARAGARVVAAGLPARPGWDSTLGRVLPHVHTKWVGVDDAWCAVGSVNLDISSAYWESEVMLVVHDPERVAAFERELDALVATSVPFDPQDPAWQTRAAQRAWLAQHWPSTLT